MRPTLFIWRNDMLTVVMMLFAQTPAQTVSLSFIKADIVCMNKQNPTDQTVFTGQCLKIMAANYKPVDVYYASYDDKGKEILNKAGACSCVYLNKDQIMARIELDKKLPIKIEEYVLNAKTYSSKGDFYISSSCILEINKADIKAFVFRPKDKAIIFN